METIDQKKKEALYELVEVPEPFGPIEVEVDDAKIKAFAFAVDDYSPWYMGDTSPFGHPIGHPLIMANDLLFLFYDKYDGNTARGLHTHERLEFSSPIRRGERVTVSGAYVNRYEKRGHGYVVLEAKATGDDGRELVRHVGTEIMRAHAGSVVGRCTAGVPTGRVVTGEISDSTSRADHAQLNLPQKTGIQPLYKHVTQEQMYVFSWGGRGYRNVHTDIGRATESGLDRTIVQAQQQVSFVTELLTGFFGATFLTSGGLDMRFISPAYADDRLTIEGAVLGEVATPAGPGLEVEIWVARGDGSKTAVGWAQAAVS